MPTTKQIEKQEMNVTVIRDNGIPVSIIYKFESGAPVMYKVEIMSVEEITELIG